MPDRTYAGVVVGGGKRAAMLGYPTANIGLRDGAVSGIYAATVSVGGTVHPAVAYADQKRKLLETHLLDIAADLYGKQIFVTLIHKMRDDERFTDDAAARERIKADVAAVRAYLKKVR